MTRLLMQSLIALVGVSTFAIGQTFDNPQYTSWSRAGKGASITLRSTTLMGDDPKPVTSTMTYNLVTLTDDKAIIEMVTVTDQTGKTVKNDPQEIVIRRPFPLLPGVRKEDLGRPTDFTEKGEGTLQVAGREYKSQWYSSKGRAEAGPTTTRTWISDEVPGMLLKSVTKIPKVKAVITLEVVEYQKP